MSCNCSSQSLPSQVYSYQYQFNPNCSSPSTCGSALGNAACLSYQGVNLACSGVNTGDTLETALQKMDTIICSSAGDYSTYNVHCLTPVTTEADFVDELTSYICTLNTTVTTFINTTYPSDQTTINNEIAATQLPAITCVSASVTSSDNLVSVLNKYCTKFGDIDTAIDISSVVWNNCFTVSSPPASIADGFNLLASQICSISSGSPVTLPTFNNSSSCIDISGTSDSLVNTVNSMKRRICQTGVFDINALTWGCTTKPSTTTTDIQSAIQAIITKINGFTQNAPTYSGDFNVTNVDDGNLCLGKSIALATPLNSDRLVAATSGDLTPGTLVDKLSAGTNITLDSITTPGVIIVNSTGGSSSDGKVFADSTDDTLGFLDDKLEGNDGTFITISTSYDSVAQKVMVSAYIDQSGLINSMMDLIASDSTLLAKFCALVASCPSPCQPPQNVQAIPLTSTTTTTILP